MKDVSCYAIDTNTQKIVAGFFFIDLFDERKLPDSLWSNPKFEPIGEAMGTVHEAFDSRNLEPNQIMKILIRGVIPAYRNKGLASQSMDRASDIAESRGFSKIISETSSLYTKKGFLKRGGKSLSHISYATFQDSKGNFPFKNAPSPHDALHLMILEINKNKEFFEK